MSDIAFWIMLVWTVLVMLLWLHAMWLYRRVQRNCRAILDRWDGEIAPNHESRRALDVRLEPAGE